MSCYAAFNHSTPQPNLLCRANLHKKKHVPGPPQHTKESIGCSVQLTQQNWTHGNGWTHLPKPRFIGRQQKGPLSLVHPLQASCHC